MIRKLLSLFDKKVNIEFTDQNGAKTETVLAPDQTVLDQLLAHGINAAYSCKAGVCKTCIMACSNPENLPEASTKNVSPAERELGYFLPCTCLPSKSLQVSEIAQTDLTQTTTVIEKTFVSDNVIRLKLETPFEFRAGQFCNLYRTADLSRSYSIASKDGDTYLEFHIKHIENGQFSSWAAKQLEVGKQIEVSGPHGECFYVSPEKPGQSPMLLCGIGTGLAPLLGIIKTAIEQGHEGQIDLVLGAKSATGFYLTEELQKLVKDQENLTVTWVTQDATSEASSEHLKNADIYSFVKESYLDLSEHQVYLCGAPSFVQKMKKQCYLGGANLSNIYSDAFQAAK